MAFFQASKSVVATSDDHHEANESSETDGVWELLTAPPPAAEVQDIDNVAGVTLLEKREGAVQKTQAIVATLEDDIGTKVILDENKRFLELGTTTLSSSSTSGSNEDDALNQQDDPVRVRHLIDKLWLLWSSFPTTSAHQVTDVLQSIGIVTCALLRKRWTTVLVSCLVIPMMAHTIWNTRRAAADRYSMVDERFQSPHQKVASLETLNRIVAQLQHRIRELEDTQAADSNDDQGEKRWEQAARQCHQDLVEEIYLHGELAFRLSQSKGEARETIPVAVLAFPPAARPNVTSDDVAPAYDRIPRPVAIPSPLIMKPYGYSSAAGCTAMQAVN